MDPIGVDHHEILVAGARHQTPRPVCVSQLEAIPDPLERFVHEMSPIPTLQDFQSQFELRMIKTNSPRWYVKDGLCEPSPRNPGSKQNLRNSLCTG